MGDNKTTDTTQILAIQTDSPEANPLSHIYGIFYIRNRSFGWIWKKLPWI